MRYGMFAPMAVLGLGVLLISGMREQYAVEPRAPMNSITKTIAGYEGRDMIVPEEERKVAGMTDYMMRVYGPDSMPVFTTYVGYYDKQVQGKSIHSPKNCLPGAGWEIMRSKEIAIDNGGVHGKVNRVELAHRGTRAIVYYWYQGRGRIVASEYSVKWNLLRDAAASGRTEEALVRLVFPIAPTLDGTPQDGAEEEQLETVKEMIAHVQHVLPIGGG